MERLLKVATPLLAPTNVVPLRVPLPPRKRSIVELSLVTMLPKASSIATSTVEMVAPAVVLLGWPMKAYWFAEPAEITKLVDVSVASDPSLATRVYVPAVKNLILTKSATPLNTTTFVGPVIVAPLGPLLIAMVTLDPSEV